MSRTPASPPDFLGLQALVFALVAAAFTTVYLTQPFLQRQAVKAPQAGNNLNGADLIRDNCRKLGLSPRHDASGPAPFNISGNSGSNLLKAGKEIP
jgi:hypothetical protein